MSEESPIIFQRSPHNKENPYAQISRELIRNEKLSPNCRWMLIYFLSMRDDFKINVKQVWNHVKEFLGRDQIYKIIDEACQSGYMKKEDRYVGNLKRGCIYYISEDPIEEFKKCFRRPDPQYTEPRDTEDQEALRSITSNTLIDNKKKEEGSPLPTSPTLSFGSHVKLKKDEYDDFCQQNSKAFVDDIIDTLNNKIASGETKIPKNYPAKLRQWIKNQKKWDAEKKSSNPEKVSKHHGFQKDTTPVDPKRVFDFR